MTLYLSNRDGVGGTSLTNEEGHYRFQTQSWTGNTVMGSGDELAVTQNSPLGMSVLIGTGDFKIDTTGYSYTGWNSASLAATISTANPSNPRKDAVVLYVDKAQNTPGTANNPGIIKHMVVAGTPAGSPVAPDDTAISTAVGASNPFIRLANVTVGTGVTQITNANISSTRVLAAPKLPTAAVATALNAPQGFLINGKISRSVASNNLTVAIKTLAGTDPTADNPVYVRIGDSLRSITAALSITINAGTNWWGMGASYFVSTDQDFFAYLIWNTATSAVAIAIAREPDMRIYSDRNATSTNHGYLVANGTAPNSTDEMEVVGRFNATLGASASYNWSLPATAIVISRPIFETRVFSASNSGDAGGTLYWQQVGAVKKVWGTGLAGAISGSGFQATLRSATFPVGFFATITSGQVTINAVDATQFQWAIFNNISTATGAIYFIQAYGSYGLNAASIDVSGT